MPCFELDENTLQINQITDLSYIYFRYLKCIVRFFSFLACYLVMEPFVGGCATVLLCLILGQTASLVDANTVVLGHPVWKVALAIHITGWILQFIGHGVFEGKLRACYIPLSLGIW